MYKIDDYAFKWFIITTLFIFIMIGLCIGGIIDLLYILHNLA